VIADLVVNHTSNQHPWFQAGRDRESPFHDFYVWADEKPREKPGDVVFPDQEDSNWKWDAKARQWYLHRFYSHQPDLNVANPAVRDEIAQVVGYWLQQGLAGFRVDAILMGEVNLPPEQQRAFFGDEDGDELHMVLSFTVNQAMYLAFVREQVEPLVRALRALPEIPEDGQWANFGRNHDELTLDKLAPAEREEVFAAFGPEPEFQLYGRGLRRRLPSMVNEDQDRIRLAYSLAFSLPGTLVLFYGEEIGMRESLVIPGRLSVRSPMQWSSERHRGFTTAPEPFRPLAPGQAEVAAQRRDPKSLLTWMELLIRRRRECPELGWGRVTLLDAGDPAVLAHRADWDGSAIVAVHSLAPEPREVRIEVGEAETAVDLFGPGELEPRAGHVTVELGRYGHRWFRLRRPGQRVAP
jgi:glycosidase